jgi:hypothetical protein
MVQIEGIAVSGDKVASLKDKHFTILKAPQYNELPDLDNEGKTKRKLVLFIELTDGSQVDYYPNMTSIKTMDASWGSEGDKWIAKQAEFTISNQKVRGIDKQVLFVKA